MDFCLDIENISILNIFSVLEKEMATHSGILAWRIPWTEEPGGLPSMGSHSQTRLKRLSSSSSSHHPCIKFAVVTVESSGL